MSHSDLMKIIDELITQINPRSVQLTGGEPFLNPYIHEAIDRLMNHSIPVQITTSGYFLNTQIEKSLLLLSNPACSIQVSLDGLRETHNLIRKKDDAFQRALQFIDYCVEHGIRVSTATVLIDQSDDEINKLCSLAKSLGVSLFRLGVLSNQGRATGLQRSIYSVEQFESLLMNLKNIYDDDSFTVGYIDEKHCYSENCGAGYKLIVIEPDLSVRPCLLIPHHIGTLDGMSISQFSEANSWRFVDLIAPSQSCCLNCELTRRCRGCIAEGIINHPYVAECKWVKQNRSTLTELGMLSYAQH